MKLAKFWDLPRMYFQIKMIFFKWKCADPNFQHYRLYWQRFYNAIFNDGFLTYKWYKTLETSNPIKGTRYVRQKY